MTDKTNPSDVKIDIRVDEETVGGRPKPRFAGTVTISNDGADVLRQIAAAPTEVALQRTATAPTDDQALWVAIRNGA